MDVVVDIYTFRYLIVYIMYVDVDIHPIVDLKSPLYSKEHYFKPFLCLTEFIRFRGMSSVNFP